jgi:hypothetical protein
VSLQKKMGGMVNDGGRYMDEMESVHSKGCEDCWKVVSRIYLKLTFVGRATFLRPGEILSGQAAPQSFLGKVIDE